jgi:predicted dehydrogenase
MVDLLSSKIRPNVLKRDEYEAIETKRMKVKILGAGSIGNHLANASRTLQWSVDLCDVDAAALERTKNQIYPTRYGKWDESIRLFLSTDVPRGGYDLIFVGTPPDSHIPLALAAVRERPRAVLVEKPFCTPDMSGAQELYELSGQLNVPIFVGYDHAVGKASEKFGEIVAGIRSSAQTLDVEFREHWGGIFSAHPWLDGPQDSYLGYWRRGGGATGEHSHAINLWQHFARQIGAGRIVEVQAMMEFVSDGRIDYDKLALLHVRTETGLVGRVVQDVVTNPPLKWARLQLEDRYVEWQCAYRPGVDAVFEGGSKGQSAEHLFPKTRPDDFIQELRHIEASLMSNPAQSSLYIERGLDSMLVIAAAYKSAREKRAVSINYGAGYSPSALQSI